MCVRVVRMLTHACISSHMCLSHFFWISANCAFHFCSSDSFKAKQILRVGAPRATARSEDGRGDREDGGKKTQSRDKKQERQLLFSLSFHPVIG